MQLKIEATISVLRNVGSSVIEAWFTLLLSSLSAKQVIKNRMINHFPVPTMENVGIIVLLLPKKKTKHKPSTRSSQGVSLSEASFQLW